MTSHKGSLSWLWVYSMFEEIKVHCSGLGFKIRRRWAGCFLNKTVQKILWVTPDLTLVHVLGSWLS